MLLYILACIAIASALLIAPALIPKHPPTKPRTRCRCGARADVVEHEWPFRSRCAVCHIKHITRRGGYHGL
jgi:hypothetical protein